MYLFIFSKNNNFTFIWTRKNNNNKNQKQKKIIENTKKSNLTSNHYFIYSKHKCFRFCLLLQMIKFYKKKNQKKNIKYNHNMIWFEINVCF